MNLHKADLEEQEVAKAVQGEKAPEEVLPDEPSHDAADDWFNEIFGGAEADEPPLEKRERSSLFETDLDFAREAFEVAAEDHDDCVK